MIALLSLVAIVTAYFIANTLGAASRNFTVIDRNSNARVLSQAKQALIGYVAQQADEAGEDNPGRLPCPEAPGNFGTSNEGIAAGSCTLPAAGRLPWRTLGIDKLTDSAGEPLWYVVSTGWALPTTTALLSINSNTLGQLAVDGLANDSVALIISPGPAFTPAAAAGCATWTQTRATSGAPDVRNYLECDNATPSDSSFVTSGPSDSFNDQVLRVTTADLLPSIEAAVADRFAREIAPLIKAAYSSGFWPATPALPFAAPFADPATSTMQGVANTFQGLLPLSVSETSPGSGAPCTTGTRCSPDFVHWTSAAMSGSVFSPSCSLSPVTNSTQISCTYFYQCFLFFCGGSTVSFQLTATAANVGMALRQLNTNASMTNVNTAGRSVSGTLNSDGSATITLNAIAPGSNGGSFVSNLICGISGFLSGFLGCKQGSISIPIALLADHPLLNSSDTTTGGPGWFLRNNWDQVAYYAVAAGIAPSGSRSCTTSTTCLNVNYLPTSGAQRGLIIIAGTKLSGQARPPAAVSDWLEGSNKLGGTTFALRDPTLIVNRSFNDRVAVIDHN